MPRRCSNKPIRPPPLPPPGLLLRVLLLAWVCFWATNSEAAGSLCPGALLLAQENRVLKLPLDTAPPRYGPPTVFTNYTGVALSVAVDEVNGFVYIGHNSGNITQMTLNGSSTKHIFSTGCGVPGFAIDPVEDKLYFTNFNGKKIEVVGVDGSGRTTVINCTYNPLALTMDLKERQLIYSQLGGSSAGIWKVDLDGSGDTQIVSTSEGYDINGISINYHSSSSSKSSWLCWSNKWQKHIQCCDYFGNITQVHNVTGQPYGLAFENDVVYYSQFRPASVGSIQLKTGPHTSLNMGSYNGSITYSMAYLHGECSMSGQTE